MSASEPIRIRLGEAGDAGAVDAMVAALAAETGGLPRKTSTVADFRAALSARPQLLFALVAEAAGRPVGLCLWHFWLSTWRGRAGIYVQDLYVAPEARGRGLGRRLLAAAQAACPQAGFIRLGVEASNAAGLRFYRGLGFERMEGEHVLGLSGEPFRLLATHEEEAASR